MTRDDFEKLALPAVDGLYAYALRLVHDREDAADLVQETFVRALGRLDAFRGRDAVRPMLFRILYNSFVDSWRKRMRRPRLVALPSSGELQAPDQSPPQEGTGGANSALVAEALSEEVEAALNALDGELRETLWLREIEDFSYAEIAAIMEIPLGTVRSRISRARTQMAEHLQHYAQRRGYPLERMGKGRHK